MGLTCTVIMAARDAAPWIGEALRSVFRQERLDGWLWDLRLAVDACEATSAALNEDGEPHWFSPRCVGPYVLRNSLMAIAPSDAWATFDADDVMDPRYLSTLVQLAMPDGIGGAARVHIDQGGARISTGIEHDCGVSVYSAAAMRRLGGFKSWPSLADRDLMHRAGLLGVPIRRTSEVRYLRRVHEKSITQSRDLGIGSKARRERMNLLEEQARAGVLHVTPDTTDLEWRC